MLRMQLNSPDRCSSDGGVSVLLASTIQKQTTVSNSLLPKRWPHTWYCTAVFLAKYSTVLVLYCTVQYSYSEPGTVLYLYCTRFRITIYLIMTLNIVVTIASSMIVGTSWRAQADRNAVWLQLQKILHQITSPMSIQRCLRFQYLFSSLPYKMRTFCIPSHKRWNWRKA